MDLELRSISKKYIINKNETFTALDNINLKLSFGLNSIVGKSGSGKSTLLNIIANIDDPTSGSVFINNKIINDKHFKKEYYTKYVSIVFQNYNLIKKLDVMTNVMLPLLIKGESEKVAKEKAKKMLEYVGINECLFYKKSSLLSGGESQRVAIARSLVNENKILLFDEPTGALDSKNSLDIMKLIKKISSERIVIVVSHNLQLVKKYSDRIIEISNGKIVNDEIIHKVKKSNTIEIVNKSRHKSWIDKIFKSNCRFRFVRNLFSSLGFACGLALLLVSFSFIDSKDNILNNEIYKQFDYGVGSVSIDEKISSDSLITLTKSTRPSFEYLTNINDIVENYQISANFDILFSQFANFFINDNILNDFSFNPVYTFNNQDCNYKLFNSNIDLSDEDKCLLVINDYAANILRNKYNINPVGSYINISLKFQYRIVDTDDTIIEDFYDEIIDGKIVGICNEINYLSSPKIYYSQNYFETYFDDIILQNISTYFNKYISITDLIYESDDNIPITSYSYRLFPKNLSCSFQKIIDFNSYNLSFVSQSVLLRNSLSSFLDATTFGMDLFLIISLIGVLLILGIISYANYSDDIKQNSIISCLGAKRDDIFIIYYKESIVSGVLGLIFSIPFFFIFRIIINSIFSNKLSLGIKMLPAITFSKDLFLVLLISIVLICILCFIATVVPIISSKKIDLKKELSSL